MTHEELEENIPLYATGALDRPERQALESHLLTGCTTCHAALKEYQAVAGLLPYGLPRIAVPPSLKKRIMAVSFQSSPAADMPAIASQPRRRRWLTDILIPTSAFQPALVGLLVLLLAGTGFYAWWTHARMADETERRRQAEAALQDALTRTAALQQQVAQQQETLNVVRESVERRAGDVGDLQDTLIRREVELEQLQARVAQMEKESAGLRRALAQRDEMLTFLRSAHVRVISLAGLEAAKSAGAFLLYDQDSQKAFFYAFNMPPLPAGKTYQVWAIVEKPMSAGVFHPDEGQKGRLILKGLPALTDIRTFAVSVEPAGGSTQPRGQIYLAGRV